MKTVSELCAQVLQDLFITEGSDTASAEDQAVVRTRLLQVLETLPEYGGGRSMGDVEAASSLTADEDQRIVCLTSGITVTLPSSPRPGARVAVLPINGSVTLARNGRRLEAGIVDLAVTTDTTWLYIAESADWVKVTALTDVSTPQLPDWCELPIIHLTVEECASAFDASLSPELQAKIYTSKRLLEARFNRPRDRAYAESVPRSVLGSASLRRGY